jgi:translocation and assembly module TamB
VAVSALDPSRVLSRAPRGRVTVLGGGAVVWPVPGPGAFSRGHLDLERLDVRLPGLELSGAGRWRDAGGMAGTLRLAVAELAEAGPALAALAGVTLPALAGRAEADLALAGTAAAPEATLAIRTTGLEVAGVSLGDGRADARLAGGVLELEASSGLALLEGATLGVRGSGRLSPGWDEVRLSRLELDLAGQAWALAAPATLRFEGPRVDRADLRSGSQRLVVSGGPPAAGRRSELQVEASGIELARLPHALVPHALGLAGTAGGALRLAGPARRRTLEARVEVAGGEVRSLTGLAVTGELAWSAETGRVQVKGSLRGGETGSLDLAADLPWPLDRAAPAAPVSGRVALGRGRLAPLLRALEVQVPAGGQLDGELVLDGSAGAPRLAGRVALADGRWADLAPLQLTVAVETPGTALHVEAALALGADRLVKAVADVPLQRGALLAHPGRTMSRLQLDPWSAGVEVPGFELAWLAGKVGVPAGLLGRVSGRASFDGSLSAPRGTATLFLSALTLTGTPPLDGQVTASLQPGRTALSIQLDDAGAPALRLAASVAAPVERLVEVEVQRQAPLVVSAQVPGLTLPGIAGERWSVSGRVAMTLETTGTLAAPRATLGLDATGLQLGGQPVGDLTGTARIGDAATALDLALRPVEGGTLRVQGTLGAVPGLGLAAMAGAPLQLTVTGRDLGVGFLPALLPGRIRAASGTVQAELGVTGSPGAPRLAGQATLAGGTLTLPSLGTFTDIGFEAAFDRDAVRVRRLMLRRGAGRVEGELSASGLGGAEARLGGSVQATSFSLARAGMDVVTIDARATIGGRYRAGRIEVEVDVAPGGTVRLPRKAPRALQPIEDRPDIIIGEAPAEPAGGAEGPGTPRREPGVTMTFRVRGDELHLKSDQPRVNIELRTDSTWEVTATPLLVSGTLEAYLGSFEPLSGRLFKVVRGKVAFPGGALGEAQLDLAADYDNPSAKVHAVVTGTVQSPNLRLTSEPALDEAKLAMLIVTGRADVNLGASQSSGLSARDSSALTAQDAGMAAAMAVANKVFENQLGAKMPVDSLTLDSSAVTAAKQLTDRILISYIRRFDARPEKGENVDEVRVQYHMTARWTLETRYGNAGAGGASIMWQRDY